MKNDALGCDYRRFDFVPGVLARGVTVGKRFLGAESEPAPLAQKSGRPRAPLPRSASRGGVTFSRKPAELARVVSVLCCSPRSHYKYMAGVVAYDKNRNAETFSGGTPVIAHPPCRCWSHYLASQARPADRSREMALGLWCVDQVKRHGGVLEQPAKSHLWAAAGLPLPGDLADPFLWTMYLEQRWFGFPTRKPTWLLVSGVPPHCLPPLPFKMSGGVDLDFSTLTRFQASRTLPELANWLVTSARETWFSHPSRISVSPSG